VRLEVRFGSSPFAVYDVPELGFLIGCVPGCDLRLPGSDLPPVCCLIARHAEGASLRKLVPTLSVQINGRAAGTGPLSDGDRLTVGNANIQVQIEGARPQSGPAPIAGSVSEKREQRPEELTRHQKELTGAREELADIRGQLYERYRQRRDRLAGLQEAVNRAARKVQDRKRELDREEAEAAVRKQQEARKAEELENQAAELVQTRRLLEEQQSTFAALQREKEGQAARQENDLQSREQVLAQARAELERNQTQYQSDLVRLDRLQAAIEQRQQQLQERAREIDQRYEELQRTGRELEEQAQQLNTWHDKLRAESTRLDKQKADQSTTAAQLNQRAAALEGQQAMLAALRTRLERLREELRGEQQQAALQQARLDSAEAQANERLQQAEQLHSEIEGEKHLYEAERKQFVERQTVMEAAVQQLREVQDGLTGKEADLKQRALATESTAAQQADTAKQLETRSGQLLELQQRLAADREALRERELALVQGEQAREALQEQLRRRSEELAGGQRSLAELARQRAEEAAALDARRTALDRERKQTDESLSSLRLELGNKTDALDQWQRELGRREAHLQDQIELLKEKGRKVGATRKRLSEDCARAEAARQAELDALTIERAALEAARQQAAELQQQLPDLELRARAGAEQLAQARVQLREHLAELHAYARQGQEEIEKLRVQVLAEAEHVRQQRLELDRGRDEHRLAVAAFRQQLIEWQGQVADMKRSLAHGETRLENRQAQVDERARQIDASSVRLAQQAEVLQEQERVVAGQRAEMERHLNDMREWYRRKIRELSLTRTPMLVGDDALTGATADLVNGLDELEPGDRKLGERLQSLDLVDADTLNALLVEAKRQRRSLRKVLLAGSYLTLYQLALIETGNLDGLVLGPLRVIDRLRVTPHEAVYRVFDPRRGEEALLRHLAEVEMEDAVRPDEFRQRFRQAASSQHAKIAATYEVLELAGRPAALQELVTGLSGSDWHTLAMGPSVWFKLVTQAAIGLGAAHQAGVIHGHLEAGSFLLTNEGVVKLCGTGEPAWLSGSPAVTDQDGGMGADLFELGRVVNAWASSVLRRKDSKGKTLPAALQAVLDRLVSDEPAQRYLQAADLLADLTRAAAGLTPDAEEWERFLEQVREHTAGPSDWRQSA
jgi:chromosome segregation ATPase